jgi:hypothetical protein
MTHHRKPCANERSTPSHTAHIVPQTRLRVSCAFHSGFDFSALRVCPPIRSKVLGCQASDNER